MDNDFEMQSVNPDPSVPIAGSESFADSAETSQTFESATPKMTWLDYLKDGVDKDYYKVETEPIFNFEEVMSEAQNEMESEDISPEREIMDIPGTPRDKLEGLANLDDTERLIDKKSQIVSLEVDDDEDFTPEQKLMKLQLEIMKMMVAGNNPKEKPKIDFEEIKKQLKKLLEEAEGGGKQPKSSVFIDTIVGSLALLTTMSEYKEERN